MVVESGEALVGVGRSVDVTGTEHVRVGSTGATVELSGVGDVEYVGFVWRSSASFDEFTNAVPTMADVEEVLIRSTVSGGMRVVSGSGTSVSLWLASGATQWTGVWSSSLGAGSYSMDGVHVSFARQTVVGIKLMSSPVGTGSFEGWDEAVFHFGRAVGAGSVTVSSSSVLEAVAGLSLIHI